MVETEILSAPPTLDPAGFFAAPPSRPSDLIQARRALLREAAVADKFESAVRDARGAGNSRVAALGSWVIGEYARALELISGNDELAVFVRGSSLLELGRKTEARKALQAAERASDPALAGLSLQSLEALGDYEALRSTLASARLAPADRAYYEARLLEAEGRYAEATDAYERLLAEFPQHFEARFRLALRSDLHGDDEAALRHYEFLSQRRPVPVAVLINLGVLYEDHGHFEKACGCYGAVLKRDPNHPRARLYFKDAHESLDMYYDEEMERKEDRLLQVLRTSISEFELSVRARNCLQAMDIRTLGDLVSHSEADLLQFKNFGDTSLNEIKRVLAAKGLRLGLRRDDGSFIVPEEFESKHTPSPEEDLSWLGELTPEQRDAMDMQISALNLSVRCHRALVEKLNLQKVGDILRYTEEDLLSMPNFGITSLKELIGKLEELGLHLRSGRGDEYTGEDI
ncbi:MAG: tetratricopeptide repeat protein [Planctomycetota bacterium]|nr:MAG: tetratricopeptide repeat protein [Planctomycetota bacterium]